MKRMKLVTMAALAVVVACDTTEPRVPTSVEVDRQTVTLQMDETVQVHATVLDQHGRAFDPAPQGFEVTWASTRPDVAAVTNGEIRGVAPGTATIRAAAGTLPPAEILVTVEPGRLTISAGTFNVPILTQAEWEENATTGRNVTSQLSFSYQGHRTGTVAISSTFMTDAIPWGGDWAVSIYDADWDDQDILAQRRRADGRFDFLWFWVDGRVTAPGTRSPDSGIFFVGYNVETDTAEGIYMVTGGSVSFASASATQLAGTFSLELETLPPNGGALSNASLQAQLPPAAAARMIQQREALRRLR
jgi:hypothetical protein